MMEGPNRGKRSVGLDISTSEGRKLLYQLAKTSDVFLTNSLPSVRQKLHIDVEHIRAANPDIIYVRATAFGDKGPDRDRGGFDGTVFWSHGGIAYAMTPEQLETPVIQGVGGFGDHIGAMNIVSGVAAALFHRAQTHEALDIDVSLLSTAWWAAGASVNAAAITQKALPPQAPKLGGAPGNPFMGNFKTSDGRLISLFIMQPGPYIRDTFEHLGLSELADDPRFAYRAERFQAGRRRFRQAPAQPPARLPAERPAVHGRDADRELPRGPSARTGRRRRELGQDPGSRRCRRDRGRGRCLYPAGDPVRHLRRRFDRHSGAGLAAALHRGPWRHPVLPGPLLPAADYNGAIGVWDPLGGSVTNVRRSTPTGVSTPGARSRATRCSACRSPRPCSKP